MNYDVGIRYDADYCSRPGFDPGLARRELQIIRDDLHCTAVRVSGTDPDRLAAAAGQAAALGLEVWLSPHLHDRPAEETLEYTLRCARAAEDLRAGGARVVFVLGCELTIFMRGILPGDTLAKRLRRRGAMRRVARQGALGGPLNAYLTRAAAAVREVFHGPVTYASAAFEVVNWSLFDFACLDHYRDARNPGAFLRQIGLLMAWRKPVVLTEVGCCAYRGAQHRAGTAWAIIDRNDPGRLDGRYVRDEAVQAAEVVEMLTAAERMGVAGTFVFTFVTPALPHHEDPMRDLDLAGYALVASGPAGGERYPGLPWRPKQAFDAVAAHYRAAPKPR